MRMGGTLAGRDVGCPIGTMVAVDPNSCLLISCVDLEGGSISRVANANEKGLRALYVCQDDWSGCASS